MKQAPAASLAGGVKGRASCAGAERQDSKILLQQIPKMLQFKRKVHPLAGELDRKPGIDRPSSRSEDTKTAPTTAQRLKTHTHTERAGTPKRKESLPNSIKPFQKPASELSAPCLSSLPRRLEKAFGRAWDMIGPIPKLLPARAIPVSTGIPAFCSGVVGRVFRAQYLLRGSC